MDEIMVGMIGAGPRANIAHYPSLAEMHDVKMVAICELNEERLRTTAEKYKIEERFTDYKLMLKKTDLNAVYIIMLPTLLDPLVSYFLRKGKNVFIEKPPGMKVQETRKWARLARKYSCKTMVGFQRRFHPCVTEAKRIIDEKGGIRYSVASFNKYGRWKEYEDGLTLDVIHAVDLLLWLGGNVREVYSLAGQLYSKIKDHLNFYMAMLEFEKGGVGILNSNRTAGGRALYFEAHGKGISTYGNIPGIPGIDNLLIQEDDVTYEKAKIIKNEELVGENSPITHYDGSFQVNRHFIDCIKEDKQPIANFEDSVRTMEVVKKILSGHRLAPV